MSSRRTTRRVGKSSVSETKKPTNINYEESLIEDEELADGGVEDEDSIEEVTRCICEHYDLYIPPNAAEFADIDTGFYIQCEQCSVWQHGYCVGIKDEDHSPEKYWCEQCRPEMHQLFTDKYGLRRSRYNSDYDNQKGKKRNGKRVTSASGNSVASGGAGSGSGANSGSGAGASSAVSSAVKTEDETEVQSGHTHTSPSPSKRPRRDLSTNGQHIDESPQANLSPLSLSRRERTRHRDAEYELQLKKALEESAKESGVVPEDADVSSNESYRETRSRKRGPESVKEEELTAGEVTNGSNKSAPGLASAPVITGLAIPDRKKRRAVGSQSNTNNNNSEAEEAEGSGTEAKPQDDEHSSAASAPNSSSSSSFKTAQSSSSSLSNSTTADGTSHNLKSIVDGNTDGDATADGDAGSSSSSPRKSKKQKKQASGNVNPKESPKKSSGNGSTKSKKDNLDSEQPFTPFIPSQRSSLLDMHRRVSGIMEFISHTQIELANEQDSSDNLMMINLKAGEQGENKDDPKTAASSTSEDGEILEMHKHLIGFYNNSIEKLDHLTKQLTTWEQKYGNY